LISISTKDLYIYFKFGLRTSGPTDAGTLSPAAGATSQRLAKSPEVTALFEAQSCEADAPRAERATAEYPAVDLGGQGASLRSSGGPDDLPLVLRRLGRSVGDLFPANRITMRCSKCGDLIGRFEGYRHIRVGERATYCLSCHLGQGLPVREAL
jgi:hypothetical protein